MDPNKAHRAMDVRHDLAHGELGLGTMANQEKGMSSIQKGLENDGAKETRIHHVNPGLESTTDHEDDATAVLLPWFPDIHRQRHAEFATIDNIAYAHKLLCKYTARSF